MRPFQTDLSIYNKFNFEKPPVGVKFLFHKPEGIERLDKTLAFCEMLKEAHQRGTPFYFDKENEDCVGTLPLGMEEMPPLAESGQIGPKLEIFQEPRANSRIYQYVPTLSRGIVNYVAFSSVDKLTFEPDLLILYATPSQAEIVLRAMSYSTGEIWEPKATGVLGCAWLYIYPYKSGKVNYMITGMGFGMKVRKVFPEGRILISIPWDWIPTITHNLKEINWVPSAYTDSREQYIARFNRIMSELPQEQQSH